MSAQTMSEQIALLKNIITNLRGQVEEADAALERICTALTEENSTVKQETDFTRLRYEGGKHPYAGHPAARSSMPELYYLLLLTVLTSAGATEAQWMHLYRVAAGAGYESDVRDLLPSAHAITDAKIIECVESLHRDNLVNAFLLDAMLLSMLREESSAMLEYIAELCTLMEVPPEAITEIIQAAKAIAAQDRAVYFEGMVDAKQIDVLESYFYLYQPDGQVIHDFTQAESIEAKQLIVLCAKAVNMEFDSDAWNVEKITFQNCIFENSPIHSFNREVHFISCSIQNAKRYEELISLKKKSIFKNCMFKNITNEQDDFSSGVLSLCNTVMEHCSFYDCIGNISLIKLNGGEIRNSDFTRCINKRDVMSTVMSMNIFYVLDAIISNCNFSYCEIPNGSLWDITSIMHAKKSTINNCIFENCTTICNHGSTAMIDLRESKEINNFFHNCSCNQPVYDH